MMLRKKIILRRLWYGAVAGALVTRISVPIPASVAFVLDNALLLLRRLRRCSTRSRDFLNRPHRTLKPTTRPCGRIYTRVATQTSPLAGGRYEPHPHFLSLLCHWHFAAHRRL